MSNVGCRSARRHGGALCVLLGLLWGWSWPEPALGAGFAVNINFQRANSAAVPGYLPDVGYVFGLRTNNLWYGWNADNTANTFERNLSADQRLDTGIKLQAGGQSRFWQILVPNGVYDVVLVAGDPADTNGVVSGTRYNVNVETVRAVSDSVPDTNQWSFSLTRHFQVSVADGLLTVTNGPNATNNSLCFLEIKQVAPIYWGAAIIDNANTHKCPNDYTSESKPGVLGYYEGHTGKKISLLHWGNGNTADLSGQTNYMAKMWARGTIPVYSWGPTSQSLSNIISGAQDAYFTTWFKTAKAYGKPIFLNFAREMNGTWYTWSEGNTINAGSPPGGFTNMWRHVHDIATRVGCTNLTWIWVVDRDINNSKHLQPISRFYPGDDYVDWVGMDVYNAGQVTPYKGESFVALYGPTYSNVVAVAPGKPLMVCETATQNLEYTPKPAWIAEALSLMPSAFPNLRGFLWFNWNDNDSNKNYPIEGGLNKDPYTTAVVDWVSVGAYSNGIASPYYLPNLFVNQANLKASPIQPVLLLDPPAQVNAQGDNGSVAVSWSAVPGATNYAVYRCTANNPITWRASTSGLSVTDTAVTNGTTYWYVIRAQNLAGESLGSTNDAHATPSAQPSAGPTAPSGLMAAAVATNRIELSWTDNSTNETSFKVESCPTSTGTFAPLATLAAGATAYADLSNLSPGTRRFYRVRASNSQGDSAPSNVVGATTFATNATAVAKYVASPMVVDGRLAEAVWDLSTSLNKATRGTPNNVVRFGALWDTNYLYLGVRVLDSARWNDSASIYDDDSVDIYIDGNHDKATSYSATWDRFFEKGWNDAALYAGYGAPTSGVLHAWASFSGGYDLEFAIPWTNFNVTPAADLTIGLDIGNNDDDDGGSRDSQCVWAGGTNDWQSTSALGDLYLSGKLATPVVNLTPASIVTALQGAVLELSWPADHLGWQLQVQRNPPGAGLGTNWVNVPGSDGTNRLLWPVAGTNDSSFFRLAWPAP